jgi:hypothetical protein
MKRYCFLFRTTVNWLVLATISLSSFAAEFYVSPNGNDDDPGEPDAPVIYSAYKDEKPVLSGALRLEVQWNQYKGATFGPH